MKSVYIASPMYGHGLATARARQRELKAALEEMGYDAFIPSQGEEYLLKNQRPIASGRRIGRGRKQQPGSGIATFNIDIGIIRSVDMLFMDFSYAKKRSIGCIAEAAIAHMLHKPTIAVLPHGNPHEHPWMIEVLLGACFETTEQALGYMQALIGKKHA